MSCEPIQFIGYAVGITGTVYGIIQKRKLTKIQLQTERRKSSYYQSRKKTEDMRRKNEIVKLGQALKDLIFGKEETKTSDRI